MFRKTIGFVKKYIGNKQTSEININHISKIKEKSQSLSGNLIEAFSPLPLLIGGKLQIFLNEQYSLGEFSEFPLDRVNALMILMLVERLTSDDKYLGTMMVSDGYTSHSISPLKASREDTFRLYFSDPWGDKSFLEEGNNILGISARREKDHEFSISYGEYEKVVVAYGVIQLPLEKMINFFLPME